MEADMINSLLELGTSGLLIWLFLKERNRVTQIMEDRIAELHSRISWLEARVSPFPVGKGEDDI